MTPRILSLLLVALFASTAAADDAKEVLTFEQHVRPILKAYCLDCHGGAKKLRGGLDLRLKRFIDKGGDSGTALATGKGISLLVQRIESGEMPPGEKKVPAEQLALIKKWVASGARTLRQEPLSLPPGIGITAEERAYWFYQTLRRPPVPAYSETDRVRTPVDAFIVAKLRERKWGFAPDADRRTLIRRASLDLLGLPPDEQEVEDFVADNKPNAYERLVDRLLASPAYGERWGRHWLDVAGYADSDGNGNVDTPRPYAWKYRDWVFRALNGDKPLDAFLGEQLAGDELVARPWKNLSAEQIDMLTATGFLRTAPDETATNGDTALAANQVVTDTLKIVGSSLLGLTVGCAQCHDHRYDPIPQTDYYRLRAVFEPALDPKAWRQPGQRLFSLYTDAGRAKAAAVEAEAGRLQAAYNQKQEKYLAAARDRELAKIPESQRAIVRAAIETPPGKRNAEQQKLLASGTLVRLASISPGVLYQYDPAAAEVLKKDAAAIAAVRAGKPVEDYISLLHEVSSSRPRTQVFYRGDHRQPTEEVRPGDLTVASGADGPVTFAEQTASNVTSGRRLAFARHLTKGDHPLLGRVMANRLWLHHFGRGIVDTPGDFGVLGVRPTHPELLDWLATELPRRGWSLKEMHRLLMTSTVYRQSSRREGEKAALDGANTLFGRFGLRRLEAEVIRDRVLLASGSLDRHLFGPALAAEEDAVGQVVEKGDRWRRSVYLQVRRTRPNAFLAAFDSPVQVLNCDKRESSTAAPQALMLMNSDFVLRHAEIMSARLFAEAPGSMEARVAKAWSWAYQRPRTDEEQRLAMQFVRSRIESLRRSGMGADAERLAFASLCQQLLSSNEFLYVD